MVEKEINKPAKTYKAGVLSLTLWENKSSEGEILKSFTIQRSYKDKDEKWQHTTNLRTSDLPKLNLLLAEAYKEQIFQALD